MYVATTRFNSKTWEEHERWIQKYNVKGCCYSTPVKIAENIPLESRIFVIEMNNDTNKIQGIGCITNFLRMDKHFKQYKDGNYNRFSYRSRYRLDRKELMEAKITIMDKCILLLDLLEPICFKGSTHSKRGQGIIQLPKTIQENKHIRFNKCLEILFKEQFEDFK